jgi:hypothetical protein
MSEAEDEASDGSTEPTPTLAPDDAPVGETPTVGTGEDIAGDDLAGEGEDDAHPAPTSATVAIATTSLAPVPIPIIPFY